MFILSVLYACSKPVHKGDVTLSATALQGQSDNIHQEPAKRNTSERKIINGAGFCVKMLSALEFLAIKGEVISGDDRKALEKEIVVFLEIDVPGKDFFESSALALSREKATQYLTQEIGSDVTVWQDDRQFSASGVSHERVPGMNNKIRVMLFFSHVDPNKKMKISYHDHLLDAGMINFGINN